MRSSIPSPVRLCILWLRRDGADAVCIVRDKGIGIPGADQNTCSRPSIAGAMWELVRAPDSVLLLVKRCLDLHRGDVQLVSKLGEGTTVNGQASRVLRELIERSW